MTGNWEDELVEAIAADMKIRPDDVLDYWSVHPFNRIQSIFKATDITGNNVPFTGYDYFYDFTGDWYRYPDVDQVVLKSRQIGISTVAQLAALDSCIGFFGISIPVVSNQGKNATKFIGEAGNILRSSPYFPILPIKERNIKKESIEFDTGSKMQAYTSSPDSLRSGQAFATILDEFAFLPEQERMLKAVQAKHSRGGSIKMISTPLATDDAFMRWFNDARNGVSGKNWYYLPLFPDNSIDPSVSLFEQELPTPICEDIRLSLVENVRLDSIEGFLQEYMCVPFDDSVAYFPTDLIKACWDNDTCSMMHAEALDIQHRTGRTYIGIDVAIERDETAIVVGYIKNGVCYIIDLQRTQEDYNTQLNLMKGLIDMYQPSSVRNDKTDTMAKAIDRDLRRRYGNLIDGVNYTNSEKEDMAVRLKTRMQNTMNGFTPSIVFPNSHDLTTQLHGIKINVTAAGNRQFSGKDGGGLDDIVNALWLMIPPTEVRRQKAPVTKPYTDHTPLTHQFAKQKRAQKNSGVTIHRTGMHPRRGYAQRVRGRVVA